MAKKKEENAAAVETEEMKAKFREKLAEILELGKKKRNILEYQEISDFFKDMNLDAEQLESVLDFLEHNNVDVLRISEDEDDDEIILDDEEEVEVEDNSWMLYKEQFIDFANEHNKKIRLIQKEED